MRRDQLPSFTKLSSDYNQHVATIVTISNGAYTPADVETIGDRASTAYRTWKTQADSIVTHPVGRIAVLAALLADIVADGLVSALQLARYVTRAVGVAGTKGDATTLRVTAVRTLIELQRAVDQLRRDMGVEDAPEDVTTSTHAYPPLGHHWPRWMTTEACAAYIDRSVAGIEGLVKRGQIPFVKQGARLYFDRDRIDRWMENGGRRHAASAARTRQRIATAIANQPSTAATSASASQDRLEGLKRPSRVNARPDIRALVEEVRRGHSAGRTAPDEQ